ncbi:hypothetical protein GCM10011418_33800 [Sphingobacterium alkalisoli]|nr:hypothetical protein GCM10011418_33800 [Sphingobacterium alkalisoli]
MTNKMTMKHTIIYKIGLVLLSMFPITKIAAQQMKVFSNLEVGDTIADITIEKIYNYNKTASKVSDFSEKLLIIDFWATWCAPCIEMLPKMNALMQTFTNDLVFLSVTKELKEKAHSFLEKLEHNRGARFNIPVIYGDTILYKLFPHYYLPHYVWINTKSREVIAITRAGEINKQNIDAVLNNLSTTTWDTKVDKWLDHKFSEPLLPYLSQLPNFLDKTVNHYSFFSPHVENLMSGAYSQLNDTTKNYRIVFKNMTRLSFFTWSFGEGRQFFQDASVKIEVKDKERLTTALSGGPFHNWQKENSFCYELSISPRPEKEIFEIMKSDVQNFFREYEIDIEKRIEPCLVLISTGNNEMLKAKGEKWSVKRDRFSYKSTNSLVKSFLTDLAFYYYVTGPILIDQTGIDYYIDLDLELNNFRDVKEVNEQLDKYKLKLVEKQALANVLIIRDKEAYN